MGTEVEQKWETCLLKIAESLKSCTSVVQELPFKHESQQIQNPPNELGVRGPLA